MVCKLPTCFFMDMSLANHTLNFLQNFDTILKSMKTVILECILCFLFEDYNNWIGDR